MGKSKGGQRGFMKGVHSGAGGEVQDKAQEPVSPSLQEEKENMERDVKRDGLDQAECAHQDKEGVPDSERLLAPATKSQLREQHKKEYQAMKKKTANMGKKMKEEAALLMKALKERHEKELAEFSAAVDDDGDENEGMAELSNISLYGSTSQEKKPVKWQKAQKRRENAAQKEADREERIAQENAELGESDRVLEEKSMNQKLYPLGFKVFDIKPDGHCLYRAVDHQLSRLTNEEHSAQSLREKAAEYLRSNKQDFLPFFVDESSDTDSAFEDHCQRVESTAEWGGEMELQALARTLDRSIIVYSVDLPETTLGHQESKGEPIRVCFMKYAYGLGNHYNSVTDV